MSRTEVRASGKTAADEVAEQEGAQITALVAPVYPDDFTGMTIAGGPSSRPEDRNMSMTPAFARMRTDWNSPDRQVVEQMRRAVDMLIMQRFAEVFDIFYQIYSEVREPVVDPETGEMSLDQYGMPEWKRSPGGAYIEDWSKLTYRLREDLLYKLTTGLFRWEQTAADLWAEAMFGRATFEEAFAYGFEEITNDRATIDDRTARARARAAEHRYRAVYLAYLSKRSDAVVRSVERLNQRLKDLIVAR